MSGIAGWISAQPMPSDVTAAEGCRLLRTIAKRGPDGKGVKVALDGRVGFAHTRLAVIDPDHRSDQPFVDPQSGAFIAFNGEIYNYRELRADLAARGAEFATSSDTEVLLKGYVLEGIRFFRRLRGMYAFAIFDPRIDEVIAARDPQGLKPLYLHVCDQRIGFGSSPAAAAPPAALRLDPAAAVSVAVLGAVLEPLSPYLGVSQLMAGTCCRIVLKQGAMSVHYVPVEPAFAWSAERSDGIERLESELSRSVDAHFTADVPVAIFQSAGLGSTIISTLARRLSHEPTLITIGFEALRGSEADKVPGAADVARALGLPHHFVYLSEAALVKARARFLADMPTPTADAFNTYLAAELCRAEGFKVALSGVGGDELFAGYPSFRQLPRLNALGAIAATPPGRAGIRAAIWAAAKLATRRSPKLKHAADYLDDWRRRYLLRRACFVPGELDEVLAPEIIEAGLPRFWMAYHLLSRRTATSDQAGVRALETDVYMRNVLLRDADWAGMAHGVEIRAPLVDVPLYRSLCEPSDRCAYRKDDLRRLANLVSPGLHLARRATTGFGQALGCGSGGTTERAWTKGVLQHWFGDWAI